MREGRWCDRGSFPRTRLSGSRLSWPKLAKARSRLVMTFHRWEKKLFGFFNRLFPLGSITDQGCWMLPRSLGSHRQEIFCCNPSWHVGSWSHQHTDWGGERRDGRWGESRAWRSVDVNDLVSCNVYAQPLSLWSFWRLIDQWPLQPLMNKRGKAVVPSQDRPSYWKVGNHYLICSCVVQCFAIFFWLAPPFLTSKFLSPPCYP